MESNGNDFTDYHKVPAHGDTFLTVMHTNVLEEAANFIAMFEHWLGTPRERTIVGLDLEYTVHKSDGRAQAALLQLCMRDYYLLWHESLGKRYCPQLINFLHHLDISFTTVDKRQDISKIEAMIIRIPNHMDMQDHFFIEGTNGRAGAGALATEIIDPIFGDIKTKFNKKLHD
jgi:hypothetical protein